MQHYNEIFQGAEEAQLDACLSQKMAYISRFLVLGFFSVLLSKIAVCEQVAA